ncbi:MAG: hypothetical protein ABFS14_08680 [Gemmatimonadota bacterium]
MVTRITTAVTAVLAGLLIAAPALQAQDNPCAAADQMATDQVAHAVSAAPEFISANAAVVDMEGNVLREGTNGWTCMPAEDPMCLDEAWVEFIHAYMNQTEPSVTTTGFGYMINCCSEGGSNTDPYAEEETADNEWLSAGGPHLMLIVPDVATLASLPTHPDTGGPWVMWRDTPYAHVMIPLGN